MTPAGGARTLRTVLDATDAEQFVGRDHERRAVDDLLDGATPSRILYVHGPGGIGKSALLRAASRMAQSAGFAVDAHDARTLRGGLADMLRQLTPANEIPRVLIIDEVEHLGSMLAPLRDNLLDLLPESARLVLAGRGEPEPSWRHGGLPNIVIDLALAPLSEADADCFLLTRGIADSEKRRSIVSWSKGYPLALTVAATAPGGEEGIGFEVHLEERLTSWLAGRTLADLDREVLEVAAIARIVDRRLLAAALPGRNTRELFGRLSSHPIMQALGGGCSMHPVLAEAMRTRLRAVSPTRYRQLVRRIAEHLATRARLGDMDALAELSMLIEDSEYRRAIGNEPSRAFYADHPHEGEFESFGLAHGFEGGADWPELLAWRAHGREFVLRRTGGEPLLWVVLVPVEALPALGSIALSQRAAAQRIETLAERTVATIAMFAEGTLEEHEEVARLASGAFMRHAGIPDLQAILMSFPAPDRRPGPNAIDSYEITDAGEHPVTVSDFRPHGAVGFVEGIVLAEQGFDPHASEATQLLEDNIDPEREARLRAVLDEVFGDSAEDRQMRAILEAAHLGPRQSEAALLVQFHVSRTTWYRLLRTARERVLSHR